MSSEQQMRYVGNGSTFPDLTTVNVRGVQKRSVNLVGPDIVRLQ
jgi:hypothetical protein